MVHFVDFYSSTLDLIVSVPTLCIHLQSADERGNKLNKGECNPSDIARSLIHDLARKVSEMVAAAQWPT